MSWLMKLITVNDLYFTFNAIDYLYFLGNKLKNILNEFEYVFFFLND